jgi:flagellar hook-associated protein 1 FlgK
MGSQSLNAQQVAIETIGNNISNINTPGYARQRVDLVNDETGSTNGEVGSGVSVETIQSVRSSLLDGLVQQSLGDQGYANQQSTLASTVQDSLGEQFSAAGSSTSGTTTADSGQVQTALTNFFGSLQTLASTPTDGTAQESVVADASTLASAINGAYQRVQATQGQIASDASSLTTQINQLSQSIASLNQQVTEITTSGGSANDIEDTRSADIEQLSGLVNVTATTQNDGSVTVALADNRAVVLVSENNSNGAGTTQSLSAAYNANAAVPLTVSGSTTGPLGTGVPSGGSLGADLNMANNVIGSPAASGNTGILGELDGVANQLRTQVNAQNALGFTTTGAAGGDIFTGTGAADLAVVPGVLSNPGLIAAGDGSGPLDGSNALAMANLQSQPAIIPAFQSMVSNLGETVSQAQSNQTTQDQVTQQLQTQQNSVSGVSIDEEMTNLINFQQAYDASAHFITTISGLMSTLINTASTQ